MRLRALASLLGVVAMVRVVPSCTDESIVLATVPSTDAGAPAAPVRCVDQSACPTGTFCAKGSCTDTTGTCQLYPAFCDPTENPVCGCTDQITYFNDCLRMSAGIAASIPGECPFDNATPCGGDQKLACPDPTQTCAQLLGFKGGCQVTFPGTCWVLPSTCPPPQPGADLWDSCSNQSSSCVDTCTAISTGGAYRRANQCQPPSQ